MAIYNGHRVLSVVQTLDVEANPSGAATGELGTVMINGVIYSVLDALTPITDAEIDAAFA